MSDVKRYVHLRGWDNSGELSESVDGEWVTHADHEATIADLQARLDTAQRELAGARGHAIEAAAQRNLALDRAETAERERDAVMSECDGHRQAARALANAATAERDAALAKLARVRELAEEEKLGVYRAAAMRVLAVLDGKAE